MASEKSKLLAKNATLLYLRQIIAMAISFYTSRVVLEALGVSDFGVFNLVGGIISMMGILNGLLGGATSRFLTYNLGLGKRELLSTTFCTAFYAYVVLGIVFFVACETIGLWIVNTQLDIPEGRMFAANVVYQVAVASALIGITQVPYSATIIAHEHFGIFAYLSIGMNVLKLVIALITLYSSLDHLILYAVLYVCVVLLERIISRVYCIRHFEESHLRRVFDKQLFRKMISFSGWSVVGNMSGTLGEQLRNIFLNRFFGTALNASAGVAAQVQTVLYGFTSNVTTAFGPQITKEYAQENYSRVNQLIQMGTQFTGIVAILVAVPTAVKLDFLMGIWLKDVPEGAVNICRILLGVTVLNSFNPLVSQGIVARGDIRASQIWTAAVSLISCLLFFLALLLTHSYLVAFCVLLLAALSYGFSGQVLLHRYMKEFDWHGFVFGTQLPIIALGVGTYATVCFIDSLIAWPWVALIIDTLLSTLLICTVAYYCLLSKPMREMARNYVLAKLHIKKEKRK